MMPLSVFLGLHCVVALAWFFLYRAKAPAPPVLYVLASAALLFAYLSLWYSFRRAPKQRKSD